MMAGNSTYNLVYVAPSDNSMTLDYNLYYRTTAGSLIDYGGVDYTQDQWATYKSASSQDAHSITPQNPLFVSAGTNFHLLPDSPARGKGVNVGLISDFDGLLLPAIPAIGAYERDSYPSTKRPFAPILY